MSDLNADKGTTRLVEGPEGPVLVESKGFIVVVRVDTQDEARSIKAELRNKGYKSAQYHGPFQVPL